MAGTVWQRTYRREYPTRKASKWHGSTHEEPGGGHPRRLAGGRRAEQGQRLRRRPRRHDGDRAPAGQPGQRLQRLRGGGRRQERSRAERLVTVAAWRESPYFTDAERAALALAEAATRLADSTDPVPDEIWDEATKYYDEQGMAALILKIAVTNVFNRLNRVTKQVPGAW